MRVRPSLLCVIALSASLALADPPEPPSVEKLIESLGHNDFAERHRALDELTAQRESAEKQPPALREQLRDKDQAARQQAAMVLAALGVGEPAVIDELLAGMIPLGPLPRVTAPRPRNPPLPQLGLETTLFPLFNATVFEPTPSSAVMPTRLLSGLLCR